MLAFCLLRKPGTRTRSGLRGGRKEGGKASAAEASWQCPCDPCHPSNPRWGTSLSKSQRTLMFGWVERAAPYSSLGVTSFPLSFPGLLPFVNCKRKSLLAEQGWKVASRPQEGRTLFPLPHPRGPDPGNPGLAQGMAVLSLPQRTLPRPPLPGLSRWQTPEG